MWSDLALARATLDCRPPFSFYFDLIEKIWKASGTNNLPLHRLCTLARKQGAATVILESAAKIPRVAAENTDGYAMHGGGGGAAEAVTISFFACEIAEDGDLKEVSADAFLGQAIVINYRPPNQTSFTISYVFEAFIPPPTLSREDGGAFLLNNYLAPQRAFACDVGGRTFKVEGVYYCQQNSQTHVCAHACLRMAITSVDTPDFTAKNINNLLQVTPPCEGLSLGDIVSVIESQGFEADITNCDGLPHESFLSLLASIIESGDQALLVFTTGNQRNGVPEEHVVLVFGHTRHSDEWHPQAIPVYAGPGSAKYLPASAWIDHFLIHDDNLGPYYTLSSQALEFDPDVRAHWIIAIRKQTPNLTAVGAEGIAAIMLVNMLPVLATSGSGRWFDFITQNTWRYVLRTILTTRGDYIEHLRTAIAHDRSCAKLDELAPLTNLPERIWMVEFSLPSLFTGNRAKLGEVLLAADPVSPEELEDVFIGLRLPGLLVLKDPQSGAMVHGNCSLAAHSPLFRRTVNGQEW